VIKLSSFPRRDQPLAPRLLASILDTRVPARPFGKGPHPRLKLAELDESVWKRFDPRTCEALAKAVTQQVAKAVLSLGEPLASTKLPTPPAGCKLQDLELTRRTYNALKRAGHLKSLEHLTRLSISEVLAVPSFGAVSLVDLLVSLEGLERPLAEPSEPIAQVAKKVVAEAQELIASGVAAKIDKDDIRLGYLVRRIDPAARNAREMAEGGSSGRRVALRARGSRSRCCRSSGNASPCSKRSSSKKS